MNGYKDEITKALNWFGRQPDTCCIGYNVRKGPMFSGIPQDRLIETPLAENLMTGMAVGLSLRGRIPLVYFERADFLTNAMDAIVNHLDKIRKLSGELHKPACILRIVVGNRETPLFTGATHTQDLGVVLSQAVSFPICYLQNTETVMDIYTEAVKNARKGTSTAVIEYKDLY